MYTWDVHLWQVRLTNRFRLAWQESNSYCHGSEFRDLEDQMDTTKKIDVEAEFIQVFRAIG